MKRVEILNVAIDNVSKLELAKKLERHGGVVVTPNVDHLMKLQTDEELYRVYQDSTYRVCDSKILQYAAKFLGQPVQEKVSGSDFFPFFCNYHKDNQEVRIFLLGGAEGVALRAQQKINRRVGRDIVVGAHSPSFGFEKNPQECQEIIDLIHRSGATVLGIGVGAPKQEKWIHHYQHQLKNIRIFLAVGATIDFEAGCKSRAPRWISELGIEWLHRLLSEPGRLWRRYLIEDLPFFWLLLKQKLRLYEQPSWNADAIVPTDRNLWTLRIGQVLQEANLVSREQLEEALCLQNTCPQKRLGEIMTERGWVERETIDFFADELPNLVDDRLQRPLGHYLKSARLLDESQIQLLLKEQKTEHLRFGELAVRKGWVREETLNWFLQILGVQQKERSSASLNPVVEIESKQAVEMDTPSETRLSELIGLP
ncbi:WecB/TagA/CpsF family glycosyltransferase [Lusitaniella coriacea LEGE 07157]|uniref:WecB/TagA/CpsF family glycosyltransferase n=1 Tax=Lusitaniella coriacea LEGE 07157 TaxID=945747 RepID=A0A8J7DW46_9CYAN|nr:WecB/TagA/CpsF family glycosyltransferase [Lusitaniella coriacea]MBE9115631.1 WecB/TagA/CpsF family glycosyltransferase [Lusitaniella coriacea LEGE 07157]